MGGRTDGISCSLEDTGKVVISSKRMFRSPFEKTGMDELHRLES